MRTLARKVALALAAGFSIAHLVTAAQAGSLSNSDFPDNCLNDTRAQVGAPQAQSDQENTLLRVSGCSRDQYARDTVPFDRNDDARAFTSEEQYAESPLRLNRLLTLGEKRSIARAYTEVETFDLIRLETGPRLSALALDLFYRNSNAYGSQITNFFVPTSFNDVKLQEYGVGLGKTWREIIGLSWVSATGRYSRVDRQGLIEFQPSAREYIDQYTFAPAAALGHITCGCQQYDMLKVEGSYTFQNIAAPVLPGYSHLRSIYSVEAKYVAACGVDLDVGYAYDDETFGSVSVPKNDFFAEMKLAASDNVAIIIRPAYLTSDASGGLAQSNSQYRTAARLEWTLSSDEETRLKVEVPVRNDIAVTGPTDFENLRIGADARLDLVLPALGNTKMAFIAGYAYQDFYNIGKELHLFNVRVTVGF
jgi:hypothetical protein